MKNAFSGKSVEAYMGGTDVVSIKSGTLTKEQAKKLQLDAQEKMYCQEMTGTHLIRKNLH